MNQLICGYGTEIGRRMDTLSDLRAIRRPDVPAAARNLRYCAPTSACVRVALRLDEFEAGKEVADFEGSGFGSVGAMSAIGADAGAEIVANGAGSGFLGVGGAHGVSPF
jgi:hypothetical protein